MALQGYGFEDVAKQLRISLAEARNIVWETHALAAASAGEPLTTQEASEMLGCEVSTLWSYTHNGLIRQVGKRGAWKLYNRSDVVVMAAVRKARHEELKERKSKWRVPA